jgi:hypothetical protein
MLAFAHGAVSSGFKVIIAGAGGAAHLPGMIAAATTLPVIGVPVPLECSRSHGFGALDRSDAFWNLRCNCWCWGMPRMQDYLPRAILVHQIQESP